jgi:hypothetical protein
MRELVFKNLTSGNKKRKDLYISETIEKNGLKTVMRRHSSYLIGNSGNVDKGTSANNKHVFISRKRDTKLGKSAFVYDVVGKFYTIINEEVYPVTFKHSLEINFSYQDY